MRHFVIAACVALTAARCAGRNRVTPPTAPAAPAEPPAVPAARPPAAVSGLASYYGDEFHGKLTASGVPFDKNAMVAAHPTLPFGTVLRVTNLANGRRVTVRVVDRGPADAIRADGVIIDL